MLDKTTAVARPKKLRSAMTNDPFRLPGIDMRTGRGRRWRDIVDALIAEFGSANPVGLRELAGLKFSLEETQAEVVKGNGKAREDLVRLSNLLARREAAMRSAGGQRDTTVTLDEIIREHAERGAE
jgi:hypothetical protein